VRPSFHFEHPFVEDALVGLPVRYGSGSEMEDALLSESEELSRVGIRDA